MTTSMKRKHRDRVVRRGLGMLIESDFYTTPAGRQHFSNQIQSIRYCVQETVRRNVFVNLNPSLGVRGSDSVFTFIDVCFAHSATTTSSLR
jgi:hypothetical protein